MFNIGAGEMVLIAVAALLLLGPKRLPELARGLGKFLREFRRQTDDIRSVVEREFYKMDQEVGVDDGPRIAPAQDVVSIASSTPQHPDALPEPPEHVSSQLTRGMGPDPQPVAVAPASDAPGAPPAAEEGAKPPKAS